jgi:hypothetical protein
MHRLVKAAVQALAAAAESYEGSAAAERAAGAAAAAAAAACGSCTEAASRRTTRERAIAGVAQLLQRRLSTRSAGSGGGGGGTESVSGSGGSSGLLTPAVGGTAGAGGGVLLLAAGPSSRLLDAHPPGSQPWPLPLPASARRSSASSRRSTQGAPPASAVPGWGPPSFAGAMLACLEAGGRLPENKKAAWGGHRCLSDFGITEGDRAAAEAVALLKLQVRARRGGVLKWLGVPRIRTVAVLHACSVVSACPRSRPQPGPVMRERSRHPPSSPPRAAPCTACRRQANRGDLSGLGAARPAHVLLLLDAWFTGFQVGSRQGRRGFVWAQSKAASLLG